MNKNTPRHYNTQLKFSKSNIKNIVFTYYIIFNSSWFFSDNFANISKFEPHVANYVCYGCSK